MKLNTFQLKIIAVICMVIDHIAYVLLPSSDSLCIIMRIVGRLAAPLFWFCFTEGYTHTKNKSKYAARLAIAAIIMMIGNMLLSLSTKTEINLGLTEPNMFLTMFFMLIAIECFSSIKNKPTYQKFGYTAIAIVFCMITGLYCEYGWLAVLSMLCLYFVKPQWLKLTFFALINSIIPILQMQPLQLFAALAVLLLMNYDNTKPKRSAKWFFYWFYPLHFWLLIIIGEFL